MWVLFEKSFRKNLVSEFGYNKITAKQILKNAKSRYKSIIRNLPEFEKGDQFKTNIVGCAMLGAFVLSMPKRPSVDELTEYYSKAMMTRFMRWLCRQSGKKKFTAKDIAEMKKTAELKAAEKHEDMEQFLDTQLKRLGVDYVDVYLAHALDGKRFDTIRELGLFDLTPAMCRLDYTMSEAGGATNFVRRYTIASGGSYCDCGYKKKI